MENGKSVGQLDSWQLTLCHPEERISRLAESDEGPPLSTIPLVIASRDEGATSNLQSGNFNNHNLESVIT
jgi:hypothetical protein